MTTPYCYLLGWKEQDCWYYGVRYAKNCDPSDLFVTYFTSSKYVKNFIEKYGNPSIIVIRKTFTLEQITEAREWEHRVLRRIGVPKNQKFLNKTHNKSRPALYGDDNPSKKPENREKIRLGTIKNTPRGENHPRVKYPEKYANAIEKSKGRDNWWSRGELNAMKNPEIIEKHLKSVKKGINHPYYKKTHSEIFGDKSDEYRKMISDMFKGIPKQKVKCPHCNKIGGKNTMGRWHFDNCKEKIEGKN